MALLDLASAQQNLAQQVSSGGINQSQADFELERLRGLNAQQPPPGTGAPVTASGGPGPGQLGGTLLGGAPTPPALPQFGQPNPAPASQQTMESMHPSFNPADFGLPTDTPSPFNTPNPGAPTPTSPSPQPINTATPFGSGPQTPAPDAAPPTDLAAAKANLDAQVAAGAINQSQANFEMQRLEGLSSSQSSPTQGVAGPRFNAPLHEAVGNIGSNSAVQEAFQQALGLAGLGNKDMDANAGFFHAGSLGRVNSQLSDDVSEQLARFRAGPFGRNDVAGFQQDLRNTLNRSANIDPVQQQALDQRLATQGGLDSQQLQGLREAGERGIDDRQASLMRQARSQNLGSGRRGAVEGAQLPGIAREGQEAQVALENQLINTNLAERERQQQGLTQQANSNNSQVFGQQSQALSQQIGLNQGQQQIDQQMLRDLSGATQQARTDLFNRDKFNFDRQAAEKQGQLGLLFGLPSFIAQQQANDRAFSLGNRELDILSEQGAVEAEQQTKLFDLLAAQQLAGGGSGGAPLPGANLAPNPGGNSVINPHTGQPVAPHPNANDGRVSRTMEFTGQLSPQQQLSRQNMQQALQQILAQQGGQRRVFQG